MSQSDINLVPEAVIKSLVERDRQLAQRVMASDSIPNLHQADVPEDVTNAIKERDERLGKRYEAGCDREEYP